MAEVIFTPEEIAGFPPGPSGPAGPVGPMGPQGPPGPKGDPGSCDCGSGSQDAYVVTDYGLEPGGPDNSDALRELIAEVNASGAGRSSAVLLWPNDGRGYHFASTVEWGHSSIRNMGLGAITLLDQRFMPTLVADTDAPIFSVTASGTVQQECPSFDGFFFCPGAGVTTAKGITLRGVNGIRLQNVVFHGLGVGLELDEAGLDCAYHKLLSVVMHGCTVGLLSNSSNSWQWWGGNIFGGDVGIDAPAMTNVQIAGLKVNGPKTIGIRLGVDGASVGAYANMIEANVEMGMAPGPRIAAQVNGGGTSTSGTGNKLVLAMHGGNSSLGNIGIDFTAGAHENTYELVWVSSLTAVRDASTTGVPNRPAAGALVGAVARRPIAGARNAGLMFFDPMTGQASVSDGTAWRVV